MTRMSRLTSTLILLSAAGFLQTIPALAADEAPTTQPVQAALSEAQHRAIVQEAIERAIAKVGEQLDSTRHAEIKNIAVLPILGDEDGYATSVLKSAVTRTSYDLFTRSDETWQKLVAEIEWGERRKDIMAAETIKKFGRIEGVDAILFGKVWDRTVDEQTRQARFKINVSLGEVETGRIVWSSGPVSADAAVKKPAPEPLGPQAPAATREDEVLQRATDDAVTQIRESLAKADFPGVKNVAVLPLADDVDGYATSAVKSAVTETPYSVVTRNDETWRKLLSEIERGVKQEDVMDPTTVQKFGQIQGVDAILYGKVWDSKMNMWSVRGQMKLSLFLADVETGKVLWSSGPVTGESFVHWSDALAQFWRFPVLLIGGLVVLIVLLLILRAIIRGIKHASRPL